MESETVARAVDTLRKFWAEMHTWETDAFSHRDWIDTNKIEPIAQALQRIYERFLVPKDRKLGRLMLVNGKPNVANIGFPPEYDPARETITGHEVKNEKTIIITTEIANHLNKDLKTPQRYQLALKDDGFRIDKKEQFSAFKNKWVLLHM